MSLGASLFTIAIGAILAFAVHATAVSWIDLTVVGNILMVVGFLGLVLTIVQYVSSRRS